MRFTAVVTACALILCTTPIHAYNVILKGRSHEKITAAAVDCLKNTSGYPEKCPLPTAENSLDKQQERGRRYRKDVRWPDDPTRQTSGPGLAKFLVNVGADNCLQYVGTQRFAGLLCNSHYGSLQFLHAMASGTTNAEGLPSTEPIESTRNKMLEWTRLAFDVSTGTIPASAPFCDTVRRYGAAGEALAPEGFAFCGSWSIASLFGQRCSNPFMSTTCRQNNNPEKIRRTALGAVLHMIQDSYSRSHAGRNEHLPTGPYEKAEVRCEAVTAFYSYSLEQKVNHADADMTPAFALSCASPAATDPITASARMIWLSENGCDSSWAVDLVAQGVLANRSTATPSAEECRRPITA
jgi:hypothetical protein